MCKTVILTSISLLIVSLMPLACYFKADKDEVPGTYIANHNYGPDTLFVFENFAYRRSLVKKTGEKILFGGKWSFYKNDILFEDFRGHLPINNSVPVTWVVEPKKSITGSVILTINDDLALWYEKSQ